LKHDKRYLGKKYWRFKAVDPKSGLELTNNEGVRQEKVTPAYAFKYKELGITLHSEDKQHSEEEENDVFRPQSITPPWEDRQLSITETED